MELGPGAQWDLVRGLVDLLRHLRGQSEIRFTRRRVEVHEPFENVQVDRHRGGAGRNHGVESAGKRVRDTGLNAFLLRSGLPRAGGEAGRERERRTEAAYGRDKAAP